MKFRVLGPSGIEASVVAFGAWVTGGWWWGGADDFESIAAIRRALDLGVTLIDTAPAYGMGRSETIVGQAIKGRRHQVVLATKCGLVWDTDKGNHFFKQSGKSVRRYLGSESIRGEIEQSLRRLQTDFVDLYQTHWQDPTTPIEETMETLLDLKREGKIRAIGVSNATLEQMEEYRRFGLLDADQERYSMLDRTIEEAQLPYCDRQGIAVLAYSPLAQGLLTGKVTPDRPLAPGDYRADDPKFTVENRSRIEAFLERIQPVADEHQATLAQVAVAWTLARPGLTHALVGGRSPVQVVENVGAADIELSDDDTARMDEALAGLELQL
jgi:aryl-alcohol dehydrogenase-like predicted oxidoreductase